MKKLLVLMFLVCFIGLASAITWDNIVYYKLDNTTGVVYDMARNYDGVNSGALRGVTGKINNAFYFDGGTDYVNTTYNANLNGTNTISILLWFKTNETNQDDVLGSISEGGTYDPRIIIRNNINLGSVGFQLQGNNGTISQADTSTSYNDSNWHMAVLVITTSSQKLYVDNVLKLWNNVSTGNITLNGTSFTIGALNARNSITQNINSIIDEVGIWHRALNSTDVSQLWNNGNGLAYGVVDNNPSITLNNPANYYNTTLNTITFQATGRDDIKLANMTLFLNDTANGTISNPTNNTIQNFTRTLPYNYYKWLIQVCDNNSQCVNSSARYVTINKILFNSLTYNATTLAGNYEYFILNASINETKQISTATLRYNNTDYSATFSKVGDYYIISRGLGTPTPHTDTNITFYYSILLSDGTRYNTTNYLQLINNLEIDDCSSYTYPLLTYKLYDEETQTLISGNNTLQVYVQLYSLDDYTTPILTYNKSTYNISNLTVCLDSSLSGAFYYMDAKMQYSAGFHRTETYNHQKYLLNSSSSNQNISLYDIKTASSEVFEIFYKDSSFIAVDDALIEIAREYVGEGTFKTVEAPLTDIQGKAVASLSPEDATYTIYVSKDGILLSVFNNIVVNCQNELTGECTLNLNEISSITSPEDYSQLDNLRYNIDYTSATRTVTVDFTIIDGSTSNMTLTLLKWDRFLNTTIANQSLTSSSGTLSATVPITYENQTIIIKLEKDSEIVYYDTMSLMPEPLDYFGYTGVILAVMSLMILPALFIISLPGMIIGVLIGVIFISLILIGTQGSPLAITGSLLWLVIAGVVIIWRLNSEGGK